MILNFKSVKVKNFLSILNAELELDNQGIVLIKGINNARGSSDSNGSGKSTVISESIYFALTGETLRGTTDVVNKFSNSDTVEVELEFDLDNINYKILRTKNHEEYGNNLKIWKNDNDISGDKLKKSEMILAEELGLLDSTLISGILILGQGLPDTFTSLKPKDRKERLEVLSQSSDFITELESRLGTYIKHYTNKQNETTMAITKKETELHMLQESIKRDSEKLVELSNREDNTEELMIELKALRADIIDKTNDMQDIAKERDELQIKLQDFQRAFYENGTIKDTKESEKLSIEKVINSLKSSKCPTCNQWIKSPEVIAELKQENESKLETILKALSICYNKEKVLSEKIVEMKNKKSELDSTINKSNSDINEKKQKMFELQSEIKAKQDALAEQVKTIEDSLKEYNKRVADIHIELSSLTSLSTEYELKLNILGWLKKMTTKDFRGYLLAGVIEYINMRLDYYSENLFGTRRLRMVLDGTKIYIEYDGRQYEGLSGGEKRLADLCTQFALRDMLKNTLGFMSNILILDEVFENIDESGVKNIIELINSFNEVGSIFVISHSHIDMPHDKVVTVVKGIENTSTIKSEY